MRPLSLTLGSPYAVMAFAAGTAVFVLTSTRATAGLLRFIASSRFGMPVLVGLSPRLAYFAERKCRALVLSAPVIARPVERHQLLAVRVDGELLAAFGSAGPVASLVRAPLDEAESFPDQVAEAASPIDDVRGTAAYRRHALRVLADRALERVLT